MTGAALLPRHQSLLFAAMLGVACARQGMPEGGSRDTTPPTVISTAPDSGATGVSVDAGLEIEFSERMNKNAVLDWVRTSPPRDFTERGWDGRRFRLAGGDGYRPNTTYTVIVGTGSRDRRENNPMAAPYQFVFSTGDEIDAGRIDGRVIPKGGPTAHGTMVWAFDVELAATRTDTVLPDYLAQAANDSTYFFLGLRTGRRYVVAAHFDANRDREFDRSQDFLSIHPDTLTLSDAEPLLTGVDIDFRDPDAPGGIRGVVVQAAPDSTAATIDADSIATAVLADTLVAARRDSLPVFTVRGLQIVELEGHAAPDSTSAQVARTDSTGAYRLRRLAPGYWYLRAFLDQNDNQRYDPGEPVAPPMDSVRVVPVEDSEEIDFIVPRWSGEE